MTPKDFTFALFVFLWNVLDVESKGKLAVQLVEFHNPQGLDVNGQCCDGVNIPTCPLEKCDHHFTICAGEQPRTNSTENECLYGREEFNAPDNKNDLTFSAGKSSLFSFDIWSGSAFLSVNVTDSDSDGLSPVDNFYLTVTYDIPGFNSTTDYKSTYILTGLRPQNPTSLSLKAKVYCDPHYYGDDCSINCVADNACNGHYTCDNKGRKVCNDGWKGDNCDVLIQGGAADCSVYQDRTEFVPSVWEGQYQCSGEKSQSFVLNITRSSGLITTVGDITIQSMVIPLSGTYASSFRILTLQGQSLVPKEIGGRNLTKLELNLQEKHPQAIEMTGDVLIDNERCLVLNLTRTKAYFDGCNMQGTCVRYGIQRDEFYCCGGGSAKPTTPTTAPPTPTTKPTTAPTTKRTTPTTTNTTTSTHIPTTSTPNPTKSTPIPTTSTPIPTTSSPNPTTLTPIPTTSTPNPTTSTPIPTTSTPIPTTSTPNPTTSTPNPTTSTPIPTTSTPIPTTSTPIPTTSTHIPTTTTPNPTTSTPIHTTSTPNPTTSTPKLTTSTTIPTTSTFEPTTHSPSTSSGSATAEPSSVTPSSTTATVSSTTLTTLKPSTSTASSTTSTPPSTSTPSTTTEMPSSTSAPSTPTTLIPPTSSSSPSTTKPTSTSTTVPTTSTTLKPSTTPKAATTPTTGKPASTAPHNAFREFVQEFYLKLVVEERGAFITEGIIKAWQEINSVSFEANETVTYYQAVGENGVEVCVVSVTLTVPYTAKEPTSDQILSYIQKSANSSLINRYTGPTEKLVLYKMDYALSFTVVGIGPGDWLRNKWSTAIWRALNASCASHKCVPIANTVINIKMMQEFVGQDGMELTKIYYFIEKDGAPLHSLTVGNPSALDIDYTSAFTFANLTAVKFYKGPVGVQYRFHYTLPVEGTVFADDLIKFKTLLKDVWALEYPDRYKDCSTCNISIASLERYIGDSGTFVTSLVYFHYLGMKIQSPMLVSSPVVRINNSMTFKDPDQSPYTLYMGSHVYRYIYHYSFPIIGQVNYEGDLTLLQSLLTNAWTNWTQANKGSLSSYLDWRITIKGSELFINQDGEFVTNLICFITSKSKLIDSRVVLVPDLTWLSIASKKWLTFKHQNGVPYQVFTFDIHQREMIRVQDTFVVYVQGYVYLKDMTNIKNLIQNEWNNITITGVSVKIMKSIIYTRTVNGTEEVLTALHYKLVNSRTNVNVLATETSVTQKTTIYQRIKSNLTSIVTTTERHYTAISTDLSSWFVFDRHFVLYFTRRLGQLDIDLKFKSALQAALEVNWKDYHSTKDLEIYVAFQEKVYLETRSVWRIVFFLKSSHKGVINPLWVAPITEHILNGSLSITSLEGHTYDLYLGQRSAILFRYRLHFHLTFTQEVSLIDYVNITKDLQKFWCDQLQGCQKNIDVSIRIKEQEHFLDIKGVSYWRLIYFVRFGGNWLDSRTTLDINWREKHVTWMSQYNVYYQIAKTQVDMWQFSYAFNLYYNAKFFNTEAEQATLLNTLKSSWTSMGFLRNDSRFLNVDIVRQHQLPTASGILWQLTYFLRYNGKNSRQWTVDSQSWPSLNSTLPKHISTSVSLSWFQSLISLYTAKKVAVTDFFAIEKDITAALLNKNPEFKLCGCYHVKVEFQEEVVDASGHTSWRLYYHVYKNDHVVSLSSFRPIDWSYFNHQYSVDGHYERQYNFSWQWTWQYTYSRYSSLGGVYLSHWLSTSNYHQLQSVLEQYYTHYYKDSKNVSVTLTSKPREYFTTDGSTVWHLPFTLKVNGTITYPPPLNVSDLQSKLNLTTAKGTAYKFISGSKVTSTEKFSSITTDHKVSTSAYEEIKAAIIKTLTKQFPDLGTSSIKIDMGPQREVVDEKGHSSWKLHYSLSVNGTKMDTKGALMLNSTELTKNLLTVTGPNGVQYHLANKTGVVSAQTLMSLNLATDVSIADMHQVQEHVKEVWQNHYGNSSSVDVKFIRQKEYVDSKGESLWKWDYELKVNGTAVHPDVIKSIDRDLNFTGLGTEAYQLKNWTSTYNNYEMHFPLYVANKVSKTDFQKFQETLHKAWLSLGQNVTVDIVSQEEIVNSKGKSVWKLVCFVKNGSEMLDGRVTSNINSTALNVIQGPRGPYITLKGSSITSSVKYSLSSSIAIDHKLDNKGIELLTQKITDNLETRYKDLKDKLSVSIVRQEEYFKTDGSRGWKAVYFVKVDGQTVRASSLALGTISLGGYKGPHGVHYKILSKSELVYDLRDRFTLTLNTKVDQKSFTGLQSRIIDAWKLTKTEYKTCGCLSMEKLTANSLEEVVDEHGQSHWQLTYFLKKNTTIVESRTHSRLNLTNLQIKLKSLTNAKGEAYSVVDTTAVSVTPISLASHFYLDHQTTLQELHNFTRSKWIMKGYQSVKVNMIRMTRLYDAFWKPWWRVEYFLRDDGDILDPAILPDLTFSSTTIQGLRGYNVSVRAPTTMIGKVDYSWSFSLTVDKEVYRSHIGRFQEAFKKSWTSATTTLANVTVSIPEQVKMVSNKGTFYWILPVFVYNKDARQYLDARVHSNLNVTKIQKDMEHIGVVYRLISRVEGGLKRYDSGFSLYLSSFIKRAHLSTLSTNIAQLWKTKDFDTSSEVAVSIVKQEELVTYTGQLVSKMTYFLQVNNTDIHVTQVSDLDHEKLEEMVTTVTGHTSVLLNGGNELANSASKTDVSVETAYDYSDLHNLILTSPILDQDTSVMETMLAKAWLTQMKDERGITVSLQSNYTIKLNMTNISSHQMISFDIFRIGFSTLKKQGILIQLEFGKDTFVSLKISNNGSVAFVVETSMGIEYITTQGVDYTDGEYHVLQLRTQQVTATKWTVFMQVDDGEEYDKTIIRPKGSVTSLLVGNNDTVSFGGFEGKIFLLQVGEFYPLRYVYDNTQSSGVQLFPPNMTVSAYSIGQNAGLPSAKLNWKEDIEDILHLSTKILFQDEIVTDRRRSAWNVRYAITVNQQKQLRKTQVSPLSFGNLKTSLNLTKAGSNDSYQIINENDTVNTLSYRNLYHLYINQRVAVQSYQNIQANLVTVWKKDENLTQDVTLMKQEKVVDTQGHTYWKLSYHVSSKDQSFPINPGFVDGVTTARLAEGVVTNSPLGTRYKVLSVTHTYRLSQAYTFVVNRRVRLQDEVKVKTGLLNLVAGSQKGLQTSSLDVVASLTDKMVDQATGQISWKYSYVVADNRTTLDASRHTELAATNLSQTLSVASGVGFSYRLEQGVVRSYSDMFGLTLKGQIRTEITQSIHTQLTTAWKHGNTADAVIISNLKRQEFVGENGTTLTRYNYFVERNGSLLYPSLTVKPDKTQLVRNLSVTVYNGHRETDYNDCHRMSLQGFRGSFNSAAISQVLQTLWAGQGTTTGTTKSNYTVDIVKREEVVGKYGLKLSALVYTVKKDSIMLTPDYQASPERTALSSVWATSGQSGQVYSGQQETFRMSGLFQLGLLGLQHADQVTEVTRTDRTTLEKMIRTVWNGSVTGNVKIDVVTNQKFYSKEMSASVNRLFYTVKIGDQVKENWQESVPDLGTKLSAALNNSTDLSNKFHISNSYGGRVRSVYLMGGVKVNETLLSKALMQAWKLNTNAGTPDLKIVSQEKFVTSLWDFFTMKVQYVLSVNKTDPEDTGIKPPSYDEVDTALSSVDLAHQCGQTSLKYNKVHVQGSRTTLNYTKLAGAIQTTWTTKNTEIASMLKVSLKQLQHRQKRAATDSYKLVDDDGHEISPVEFTVALNQEEPSPMFLDKPSDQEVNDRLSAVGTKLCMCKPRLAAQLKVKGHISDNDKDKVKDAVKEAFLKKNPDLKGDDLGIDLSITNVTDSSGKHGSDVDYIVTRKDNGDVEDLVRPDEAKLMSDIQSMYSKMEKVEDEDEKDDWVIPVAVACGVFVFILIIVIICYVIYIRRHRKKGDLIKQEDNVKNRNSFDKEHFSDPAMYDDQGPLKYDNPAYDNKLYQ